MQKLNVKINLNQSSFKMLTGDFPLGDEEDAWRGRHRSVQVEDNFVQVHKNQHWNYPSQYDQSKIAKQFCGI